MATIYRALLTAVLAMFGWVAWTGWQLGLAEPAARDGAIALHVHTGLVVALVAAAAQSVPFAYFLGTGFWVKAFVRASRAGPEWERRHKLWMKGRAYPLMYLAPMLTLATAVTGGLVHTGRVAPVWHGCSSVLAIVTCAIGLVLVPPVMLRNSALMDELADRHQVPRPGTPAAQSLVEHESRQSLPPLFQLSRVLMFIGVQFMIVWLYLRFGTDGWRDTRVMPFAASFVLLLTVGLGLNATHDPQRPRPPGKAWGRALLIGTACAVVLTLLL